MGYEIDYIPVGEGEKGGDAIALRFGNLHGPRTEQSVVVIDGGYKDSGEKLVEHIKSFYGTDHVDLVVLTHPDSDHASGLSVILEKLSVGQLAMHRPWLHGDSIKKYFNDGRITGSGLNEKLEKSLQYAGDLEAIALRKGIPIVEPFQGITGFGGKIHILGPSVEYYQVLLALIEPTPAPIAALGIFAPAIQAAGQVVKEIQDFLHIDLLDDDTDSTSPMNNSSAIILLTIDGHKILFTGDSGKTALNFAADYAGTQGIILSDLTILDVPHHGSKRNINSKLMKRIMGKTASISAPPSSTKHPSKRVINALKKHQAKVYVTKDKTMLHSHEAPQREGWGPAPEEPFYTIVEE